MTLQPACNVIAPGVLAGERFGHGCRGDRQSQPVGFETALLIASASKLFSPPWFFSM